MSSTVELIPLLNVVPPENFEVGPGFNAVVNEESVHVRAVLERTVVVEHSSGERTVVRKDLCLVKEGSVPFIPGNPNGGVGPRQWRRLPGKPPR
ncbi:MAG: hypothetical protein JF888_14070 [Candidatus Dormibacteraeota bacterium]|uniref:Uncharacterized protein n=1 Tax=Candidatus Dormiibacter inghamiae TaxID=3127013 RepID=A0A934KIV7_9BACT|nr:hypothetical protein [Candidatus Dormibacteraeota bacterium]MBJ7605339.1 hypothetical protein [Candidatus Dormibacteraeota bacterium]MDQ6636897.1 hypothetical protein [Candidatus Dormibacteraeota bacterium]PZR71078.1 MAG: hypothetical protein DLM66_02105 [Candidatus Dormibacteraeota bacterium]